MASTSTLPQTALQCLETLKEHHFEDVDSQKACERLDEISKLVASSVGQRCVRAPIQFPIHYAGLTWEKNRV